MKKAKIISLFIFICTAINLPATGREELPARSPEREKTLTLIKSLPYLQGYKKAPEKTGVIRYDRNEAYPGLNFYICGSVPGAFLTNMEGETIHKWMIKPEEVELPEDSHCRRAHIFPDGKLLGIFEGDGELSGPLIKLDRDSKILWKYPGNCHHDLFVTGDERIYVLTHRERDQYPGQHLTGPILEDFITVLTPEGKEIRSISLIKCFVNSPYFYLLAYAQTRGDIFHTNTIEVLDGELE
ncbi:MAG: hypothetical protein U9N73_11590, partial [Candidatus Auribacterota bacterium]|nr:hypothetical protein [Candidatus Auribacterota bacterium]